MPSPTRPCRCSVGRHPAASDIDAALATGGPENSLSKLVPRFPGVSRTALGAHRLRCLGLGTARDGLSTIPDPVPASSDGADPPAKKRRIGELPPGAPTKEARVVHIINLMARLEWVTGVTGGELAAEWGVHPGTVEHDACEASRAVLRQVDPGAVQATVMAALHEALNLGLDFARTKIVDGRTREGDPKALNSIALLAKSMAVYAPAPVAVRPGLTPEQRPLLSVHYPPGVSPAPLAPPPAAAPPPPPPNGSPLQPAPSPGAPGARPWP